MAKLFLPALCALLLPLSVSIAEEADETRTSIPAAPTADSKVFQADAEWAAIRWRKFPIVPGSALDFSGNLDAPAGKYGAVVCRDGRWAFQDRPDKPVRFYGTHITHGLPFVGKEQADQLADYLAASGFNIVRFHSYTFVDGVMKEKGSAEFAPEKLDQLDYMFAALRKRGVYYTLPLNVGNFFKAGDVKDVPEFAGRDFRFEIAGLMPVSADARAWFHQYIVNLLCHPNPYTGMALKDDPALACVEISNESGIFKMFGESPELIQVYRRLCGEELRKKNGAAPSGAEVEAALPGFALAKQEEFIRSTVEFLRSQGVAKPLTDISNRLNLAYELPRSRLDYVDGHDYWDLYKNLPQEKPSSGREIVYRIKGTNPLAQPNLWSFLPASTRVFGLPFSCGEFNSDYPSPYWTFITPTMALAASLQDWGTAIRCGLVPFPDDFFKGRTVRAIAAGPNPLVMLSERIGEMLFVGNEIAPLAAKVPFAVTPEYVRAHLDLKGGPLYPPEYNALGTDYQLGTLVLDGRERLDGYPCFVVPADMAVPDALKGKPVFPADAALAAKVAQAAPPAARPWKWDRAAGTLRIATPRTESFLLPAAVAEGKGACVSVSGNKTVSLSFAGSLDGKPLAASRRVLALYLTDVRNTGCEITREKDGGMLVRALGDLPLLVRQATVEMAFHTGAKPLPKIWALKGDGTRGAAVAPRKTADGFAFDAVSVTDAETFGAFELAWEP